MSLLQATNIEPSVSGAGDRGSAVVDLTEGLTISWQVNGSSPMVAYRVWIYKNDAASTSMYNTSRIPLATPFYGRNELGEPQFFSFTIPAATVESAQLTNGNEYKYVITQWWGDTDAESITQSSADVLIARSKPVLTIDPIGTDDTVTSNSQTFTATYSQAQGDGIESVRWEIFENPFSDTPLATSGTIYTSVLSWTYDGFTPTGGISPLLTLRCTVVTEQGVEVTAATPFAVNYNSEIAQGLVNACCVAGYSGAVRVSWPVFETIDGVVTGSDYEIQNGQLVINKANTSIAWNFGNVGGDWTVFWAGQVKEDSANFVRILKFDTSPGVVAMPTQKNLGLGVFGTEQRWQALNLPASKMTDQEGGRPFLAFAITPEQFTWRYTYIPFVGGTDYVTATKTVKLTVSIPSFSAATLTGGQWCEFLYVKNETLSEEAILNLFHDWFPTWDPDNPPIGIPEAPKPGPVFDSETVMLAVFNDGLQAGSIHTDLGTIKEYTVYRTDTANGNKLIYEGTIAGGNPALYFYDYSIPQNSSAAWYVWAKGTNGATAGPMTSKAFAPFFWDWIVIRAAQQPDGTYLAKQVFRFGKNLSSGQIGNNNNPEVLENFTPYPTVLPAPQNYRSGTLSSLIGVIDENGRYSDTIALRDAIYELSPTTDTLFLKNRKGDLMQIVISGPVMMETNDASASQAQKVSLPWAEVGSAEGVSIIALNTPL